MFNLEAAIADWRRQMLSSGMTAPVPLDELESHLREQLAGVSVDQKNFDVAIAQLGDAHLLRSEFKKVNRNNMKRKIMIAAAVLALFIGTGIIMPALAQYGRHNSAAGNGSSGQWAADEITMLSLGSVITLGGIGTLVYAFTSRRKTPLA